MNYYFDTGRLLFFIILSLAFAIYLLAKSKDTTLGWSFTLLIIGITFLSISVIYASNVEDNWTHEFIVAFLSFKLVGCDMLYNGAYYLRSIAYTLIFGGIVQFGIATFYKMKQKREKV
jgi:hypothetical protein